MTVSAFSRRKNAGKAFRVILQILILLIVALAVVKSQALRPRYQPEDRLIQPNGSAEADADNGFIALSYFGVSEVGTQTRISREMLEQHLTALKDAGYVTITQRDILDYYYYRKQLPEKALFLLFEDGRRDSAMLAQPILEACNFKASILSYANNLEAWNQLFLTARDLRALVKNSYWELGTNGYRLSYINVFDRHNNYLGEMTPDEYFHISPYVRREYNHYLMDFLRDAYDIPLESMDQMSERIATDYQLMKTAYERRLGGLPDLYVLMHSNTNQFATNDRCSVENERWLKQMFSMNFNREMYSYNDRSVSIYDLTRMQPQAYWSVNHLIMRIRDDTGTEIPFKIGDTEQAALWSVLSGAAEFRPNEICVTSQSQGTGVVRLIGSERVTDFFLSTRMNGNKLGTQSVDLLLDPEGQAYVAVEIQNNVLQVYVQKDGVEALSLFELNLDKHDGIAYQAMEENRQEAMAVEIQAKLDQRYKAEESALIAQELIRTKTNAKYAASELYIPEISVSDAGSRLLQMTLREGLLDISVDGKTAAEGLPVGRIAHGVALRAAWSEYGYSQRNVADDVYDGVFQSLYLTRLNGSEPDSEAVMLDQRIVEVKKETLVDWMIIFWQGAKRAWRDSLNWLSALWRDCLELCRQAGVWIDAQWQVFKQGCSTAADWLAAQWREIHRVWREHVRPANLVQ